MYRFYIILILLWGMIGRNMLMKVYLVLLRMGVWSVGGIPLVTVIRNTWRIILNSLLKLYPCQLHWVGLKWFHLLLSSFILEVEKLRCQKGIVMLGMVEIEAQIYLSFGNQRTKRYRHV